MMLAYLYISFALFGSVVIFQKSLEFLGIEKHFWKKNDDNVLELKTELLKPLVCALCLTFWASPILVGVLVLFFNYSALSAIIIPFAVGFAAIGKE